MAKGAEAFRSIGEVAKLIGVAPHVLRYWETQFTALKPMKRPDGRRYYRPADLNLAAGIWAMLRDDGLTIRGARKLIALDRGETVRLRGAAHLSRLVTGSEAAPEVPEMSPPPPPPEPTPETREVLSLDNTSSAPHRPGPSFPSAGQHPASPQGIWLVRLTDVTRHLQQITPNDARWPQVRPAALRLGQAMLRLA